MVVFSASCCYLRRRGAACEAVEAAEAGEAVAAVEAVEAVRARACECEWRRLPGRRPRVASVEPLARGMPGRRGAVKRRPVRSVPVRSVPERPGGEACEVRATVGAQGGRGWRARARADP